MPIADPRAAAQAARDLAALDTAIAACDACPRLVAWREEQARVKVARFRDETYWAHGVPGFGDSTARILLVGLAPAAHGANRTGRVFTGDASGDFLWRAMHEVGLASQPDGRRAGDGLQLDGVRVLAAVRCAPPANKPTPDERDRCRPFFQRELALLDRVRVVVPLGQFAYHVVAAELGVRPRPRFAHGLEVAAPDGRTIVCSYHVSQQNTFTGTLTEPMLDAVFARARALTG